MVKKTNKPQESLFFLERIDLVKITYLDHLWVHYRCYRVYDGVDVWLADCSAHIQRAHRAWFSQLPPLPRSLILLRWVLILATRSACATLQTLRFWLAAVLLLPATRAFRFFWCAKCFHLFFFTVQFMVLAWVLCVLFLVQTKTMRRLVCFREFWG